MTKEEYIEHRSCSQKVTVKVYLTMYKVMLCPDLPNCKYKQCKGWVDEYIGGYPCGSSFTLN